MADNNEFGDLHNDPAVCPMWYDWCRCTPRNVLVRALELRVRRQKAHDAWAAAVNHYWDNQSVENYTWMMMAENEWDAAYEDYRRFLVSVGASNLDEVVNRANLAARKALCPRPK